MSTVSLATVTTSAARATAAIRRPKELRHIALLLTGIAVWFPIQVMMAYGYSPFEIEAIVTTLAPMNWVVMGASLIHAGLVFRGSRFALLSGSFFLASVAWNNWLVGVAGLNEPWSTTALSTLGAILSQAPLLKPEIRKLILNEKLRWWRTPPRLRTQVDAVVRPVLGGEMKSRTFDISEMGAFITMEQTLWDPLQIGARCTLRLVIDPIHSVHCAAEIVRRTEARGGYPAGFAVRFLNLEPAEKKILASLVRSPSLESLKAA